MRGQTAVFAAALRGPRESAVCGCRALLMSSVALLHLRKTRVRLATCRQVTPDNVEQHVSGMRRYNFNEDCPVFDGLFDYCRCAVRWAVVLQQCVATPARRILWHWV
jgi:acetoin utilization deacetylase AcuC-like enzyme